MYRLYASVPFKSVFLLVPYKIGDEKRVETARRQLLVAGDQSLEENEPPTTDEQQADDSPLATDD